MVAVQVYLHALTGSHVQPVKDAAKSIISTIDSALNNSSLSHNDKLKLYCERGFADHLLGDTYAHANPHQKWVANTKNIKDGDAFLFPTGLGHFKDNHDPDYMLTRNFYFDLYQRKWNLAYVSEISHGDLSKEQIENQHNLWNDWLQDVSCTIARNCSTAKEKYTEKVDNIVKTYLDDAKEKGSRVVTLAENKFFEDELRSFLKYPEWEPYDKLSPDMRPIEEWNNKSSHWFVIGKLVDMYTDASLDVPCSKRVEQGLNAIHLGLENPETYADFCNQVWNEYRTYAVEYFPKDIEATQNCDTSKDQLEYGQ